MFIYSPRNNGRIATFSPAGVEAPAASLRGTNAAVIVDFNNLNFNSPGSPFNAPQPRFSSFNMPFTNQLFPYLPYSNQFPNNFPTIMNVPPAYGAACPCCGVYTGNPLETSHEEDKPEKCWQHRTYLSDGGWKEHLQEVVHTRCPRAGCAKTGADFGSDQRFLQHWRNKHPDKCWYWARSYGFWGGEKVKWRQWNGH